MQVFLDANILFSASNTGSAIARFVQLLVKEHHCVTSSYAMMEAERNILLKRSQWTSDFETLMKQVALVPEATLKVDAGLPDKDIPILGAAIASKSDYLLTGDKRDFGHLYGNTIEEVMVISYLQLAEIVLNG